ncbi:MAG TPA: carboxymuconolactone decarboxylase family protein [Kofleriaceae bacterium]
MVKLAQYRPDFYGAQAVTHEAMRGPSAWSVADRELMAAVIARTNESAWCTTAHSAVAARAYRDRAKVDAVLADLETAPIEAPLRATLRMLRMLAKTQTVDADDMRAVLAAGVSSEQVKDALSVAFAFNITARLAEAFDFAMAEPAAFDSGAKYLLARGYR